MFKTIILSDLHLCSPSSDYKRVIKFINKNSFEKLFLCGDIIDYLYLERQWLQLDEKIIRYLKNLIDNYDVIYINGNHDKNPKFKNYDYFIYESFGKKYFIHHGHNGVFKNPITDSKLLLGLFNYTIRILSKIKKHHSGIVFKKKIKIIKDDEFESLTENSKLFFKNGLKIISFYKLRIKNILKKHSVDYIICGHIHYPEIREDLKYMNSGDCKEHYTALCETMDGKWKIIQL